MQSDDINLGSCCACMSEENVRTIVDDTPNPHHGCRPRKRKLR